MCIGDYILQSFPSISPSVLHLPACTSMKFPSFRSYTHQRTSFSPLCLWAAMSHSEGRLALPVESYGREPFQCSFLLPQLCTGRCCFWASVQKLHVGSHHKQLYQLAIFFVKMETLPPGSGRPLLFLHPARYLGLALQFWVFRASCQEL